MNPTVENLVSNANKIAAQASHQNPKRKRYPKELKSIVHSLINKHKLSVHQVTISIPNGVEFKKGRPPARISYF